MKPTHYIYIIYAAALLASCDSGNIEDKTFVVTETGRTVKVTARVSGISEWSGSSFTLAAAAFTADSKYALMQRALPSTLSDGQDISIVLSNISDEVQTVELSLTNSLRKRIVTLAAINMNDYASGTPRDTILLALNNIDVSRFGVLQMGIFDKACIQCHGGNGRSAAGLNLTEGNARANLVDIESSRIQGVARIKSGSPDESLLHLILSDGAENLLSVNHTEILSNQFKQNLEEVRTLIDSWIESLAQ